jgi:5-methylcytosine-specific restriction endonuclease McrA
MNQNIKNFFSYLKLKNDNISNYFITELFNQFNFTYNNINLALSDRSIIVLVKYFDGDMLKILIEINNVLVNSFYKININNLILFNQTFTNSVTNYFYIYSINKILNEIYNTCIDNNFYNYYNEIINNYAYHKKLELCNNYINYFYNIKIEYNAYLYFYTNLINYYNNSKKEIIVIEDNEPSKKKILIENNEPCKKEIIVIEDDENYNKNLKYKRPYISSKLRTEVWNKRYGNRARFGLCVCCEIKEIYFEDFVAGHEIAVAKGGTTDLQNLEPICRECNSSMGTKTISEYKKLFVKN